MRPIGTEFDVVYPPAECSTDLHPHRLRYLVLDHVLTIDGLREHVRCVGSEELPLETCRDYQS